MTPKVFERIYVELKREVTSGRYGPGQRLQARSLADTLGTSTSPVTHAMRQLVGEAVLEYSAEDGFIIPRVTVRRLRDLYGWVALLTNSATDGQAKGSHLEVPALSGASDVIETTEGLFVALAHTMQNGVFASAIENVNDRLRAARQLEALVFRDIVEEISALVASAQGDLTSEFRKALGRYNKRRFDAVSQIVVLSYQDRRP